MNSLTTNPPSAYKGASIMDTATQLSRAERFRALHESPKVLILPNVWDPLGARLLEGLGCPALATASWAISYAHGVEDGENLSFPVMLEVIRGITEAARVPVSADVESGYARTSDELARNIALLLEVGVVGINLEDTDHETGTLYPVSTQQERIRTVRRVAKEKGIPLFLNARIDVFVKGRYGPGADKLAETAARAEAYLEAGADGIYPILLSDLDSLRDLASRTKVPVNVYATASAPSVAELEAAGIARLSLGPGLFKATLTRMKEVVEGLMRDGSYAPFSHGILANEEITRLLIRD
jgi:2-methylisocitrate lyase-like PEP mutase family enzyme